MKTAALANSSMRRFIVAVLPLALMLTAAGPALQPSAEAQPNPATHPTVQANANTKTQLRFNVVSIRPSSPGDPMVPDTPQRGGYWVVRAVPTAWLIYFTFETQPNLVFGMPAWAKRTSYTIEARMPPLTTDSDLHRMLQSMFRDRFGMVWHSEMRPAHVSTLSLGTPTSGLRQASGHCLQPGATIPAQSNEYECGVVHVTPTPKGAEFSGYSVTLSAIARFLTRLRLQPVVDISGSKALYDFDVKVAMPPQYPTEDREARTFDYEKAIQTAFKRQLGVDVDMTRTIEQPVPVLVIDHLAKATPN